MTVTVSMPQLGESVTEGTVTRWLKKEGERVEVDEPLLEVSTDKVDTEIPSPASGVLRGISVDEDETVAVGAQLAVIDDGASGDAAPGADGSASAAPGEAAQPAATQDDSAQDDSAQPALAPHDSAQPAAAEAEEYPPPTPLPSAGDAPYVTPLVRKLAAEHAVDLESVTGTGVGGRIRKQDVIEAARAQRAAQPPAPPAQPAAQAQAPQPA